MMGNTMGNTMGNMARAKIALPLFFALVLVCALGCTKKSSGSADSASDSGKLTIISSIFPSYDFARQIAGERAVVTMLLPPAAESHSYEPTPRDIIAVQRCDLFIYTGGESDAWIDDVLSTVQSPKLVTLKMMDAVTVVTEEIVEGMQEEDAEDGEIEEAEYDEHVWTSVRNAKLIVLAITEELCRLDAEGSEYYRERSRNYCDSLDALDASFRAAVAAGSRNTLIFGDRFPFRYLADDYNLNYFAAFPGCSTETEPSAATVAFLINKVKAEHIPVVFFIELSNERMADAICEATGAQKLLLHACHNISKKDFENGITYLTLQTQNVENLRVALQ
ncbi:MAG: metal ABC transporter substrate-binding protein [Treponemataceae bacterium]|nr:MAG: metal ABC transporter substrate-binding protein [Treponemataceae bacterium]